MASPFLQQVESAFRKIDQPIWIVTSQHEQKRSGLTATWIHQAAIDREHPTVLLGLAPNHFTCETLRNSRACVIHLLHRRQSELAFQFSRPSSRNLDKFTGLDVGNYTLPYGQSHSNLKDVSPAGELENSQVPWLPDCHSALACTVLHEFDAGDRVYFLAKVVDVLAESDDEILRESDFFAACSDEQLKSLKNDLAEDVNLQRPLLFQWLNQLKSN